MLQCRVIFALILVQVCDGGYGKDVMKKDDAIGSIAAHPCKKRKDGAATFRYGKETTERWRRMGQPPDHGVDVPSKDGPAPRVCANKKTAE
jgi:hypothetical protein